MFEHLVRYVIQLASPSYFDDAGSVSVRDLYARGNHYAALLYKSIRRHGARR